MSLSCQDRIIPCELLFWELSRDKPDSSCLSSTGKANFHIKLTCCHPDMHKVIINGRKNTNSLIKNKLRKWLEIKSDIISERGVDLSFR